jgi:hypothetical protein
MLYVWVLPAYAGIIAGMTRYFWRKRDHLGADALARAMTIFFGINCQI